MNTHTKITALASTILLSVCFAGPAKAAPTTEKTSPSFELEVPITAPIQALSFDKPTVTTSAAPIVQEVVAPIATQSAPVATTKAPVATATAPVATTAAPAAATAPAPVQAAAPSNAGQGLLASAYGQIGIKQDCTRMVENALASIGIISGDLAPNQFFRFGTVVAVPAPGDILISAGHVGIYAGNGQMISGGFNGSDTVLHPVSYVGAYTAVRL